MANSTNIAGFMVGGVVPDKALRDFFQSMIKGITGLSGNLVRPMWQPNPPKQPDIEGNWCAFGWNVVNADINAEVKTSGLSGNLVRHEDVELTVVFYGDTAYGYASLLRDGLELYQNLDTLRLNGIAYTRELGIEHRPELINDVWYDRHDLKLRFNREVNREYNVLSFVDASGLIITDNMPRLEREFNTVIPQSI